MPMRPIGSNGSNFPRNQSIMSCPMITPHKKVGITNQWSQPPDSEWRESIKKKASVAIDTIQDREVVSKSNRVAGTNRRCAPCNGAGAAGKRMPGTSGNAVVDGELMILWNDFISSYDASQPQYEE